MLKICSILIPLSIAFSISTGACDTLILKDGRKIVAAKCWEEPELIKCQLHGQVIGYQKNSAAQLVTAKVGNNRDGLHFDIWNSGISVDQATDLAQLYDLPLHCDGLISANKTFNPKICIPCSDRTSKFYYNSALLGKPAKVTLTFTPTSRKLYSTEILWSAPDATKTSLFRDKVEAMLRDKYGKPEKVQDSIVFKTYTWRLNGEASLSFRPGGNYLMLVYTDEKLARCAQNEVDAKEKGHFTVQEKNRF